MNTPARIRWSAAHLFMALCAIVTAAHMFGCETTEGAGRDIEKLGDNIEDAASDAKD